MFKHLLEQQKHYFQSGITKTKQFRASMLEKLHQMLLINEAQLLEAVGLDLGKSEYEAFLTELALTYEELHIAKRNLSKWMKPVRVKSSITTLMGKSMIFKEPYGTVLIISPWNYPIQLTFVPLISAIAAGNTAIIKVSSSSAHTAKIIEQLINNTFDSSYIACTPNSSDEDGMLISMPFDYIFFTGSTKVGKLIMQEASKNLVPLTLELGGKSPCIVEESADLILASKRIVLGKIINSGQTCVAPDYILVQNSIKDKLVDLLWNQYMEFYPNQQDSPSHPRIINDSHLDMLRNLIVNETVIKGANISPSTCKMSLTLVDHPTDNSPLMQSEIFGPILPIIGFDQIHEAIHYINQLSKPLALYCFTNQADIQKQVIDQVRFGGGAINDTIMHLANPNLPFGGIGHSGMGRYHGKYGFDTFSHEKSILFSSRWFDLPMKYPPFDRKKTNLVKRIFK